MTVDVNGIPTTVCIDAFAIVGGYIAGVAIHPDHKGMSQGAAKSTSP